jgi:hypothetical protein
VGEGVQRGFDALLGMGFISIWWPLPRRERCPGPVGDLLATVVFIQSSSAGQVLSLERVLGALEVG